MREETTTRVARLSWAETVAVLIAAGGPLFAKGIIVRRPLVVRLLQALGLERAGVGILQRLRQRHGPGPLLMRLPGRQQAVLLSPDHVRRVLAETPDPFATASSEKRAALGHFEPDGSLISRGQERAERRQLNERALESGCPIHSLGARFAQIIQAEIGPLAQRGSLSWGDFKDAWFRAVRRIVLGDGARVDKRLTADLIRLRSEPPHHA